MKDNVWIVCDYGGVIADDHCPEAEWKLANLFGCAPEIIRKQITEKSPNGRAVRLNKLSERGFWESVSLGISGNTLLPAPEHKLTELWSDMYSVRPYVMDILHHANRRGALLGIATNVDQYRHEFLELAIKKYSIEFVVFGSWKIGSMKPDGAFFEAITKQARVQARSILFFDDRDEHVDAARESGWMAHKYIGKNQMRSQIEVHLNNFKYPHGE